MPRKEPESRFTPRIVRGRCEEYFSRCDQEKGLYGEAGLALAVGVPLETLRSWFDGRERPDLQEEVRRAYLRIQSQLETSPAYMGKGMVSKAVFLMKQPRLGGYLEKTDVRQDLTVHVKLNKSMDESDFK